MNGLLKAGYFLLGVSSGLFVATLMYDAEMTRAVGEIEEYIPNKDRDEDISDKTETIVEDAENYIDDKIDYVDNKINHLVSKARERRADLNVNSNKRSKVDYKNMYYNSDADEFIEKIVDMEDEDSYSPTDDEPIDGDISDDDLVRERVEEWVEVYLGENPQDFITLIFYIGDETLCDDREQLITNPEEVVGSVALERLVEGGPGAEDGTIFVRNLKTMLNYEVVLDVGKYSETVLGIFESRLDKGDGGDVEDE